MRIILATRNQSKLEEIKRIFVDSGIAILGVQEAGGLGEAKEDQLTLVNNAHQKALFFKNQFPNDWIAADDSGLFIEAFNEWPGVHSARCVGRNVSTEELTRSLLQKMEPIPFGRRQAFFETVAVLLSAKNDYFVFSGRIRGQITNQALGTIKAGMPYDPIFVPDGHVLTFAQMPLEDKNLLSHRGKAFGNMRDFLKNYSECH